MRVSDNWIELDYRNAIVAALSKSLSADCFILKHCRNITKSWTNNYFHDRGRDGMDFAPTRAGAGAGAGLRGNH